MSYEYIIEMICDWRSFSHKVEKLTDIFGWYEKHKDIKLGKETRKTVESILDAIKKKLEELDKEAE